MVLLPIQGNLDKAKSIVTLVCLSSIFLRYRARLQTINQRPAASVSIRGREKHIINAIDTFILDCDGVLWRGDSLLPDVVETLSMLRSLGKQLLFVTNNSKSRKMVKQKFDKLGIEVNVEEIVTASSACANYVKSHSLVVPGEKVFLIGSRGLEEELALFGVTCVRMARDDAIQPMSDQRLLDWEIPSDIRAVIVGGDYGFTFTQVSYASACLLEDPSRPLICTARDAFDQLELGRRMPGEATLFCVCFP